MLDGAVVTLLGFAVGALWTWFITQRKDEQFAAERAKHIKERDAILRALGNYETRLQEYESAGIPPEEM